MFRKTPMPTPGKVARQHRSTAQEAEAAHALGALLLRVVRSECVEQFAALTAELDRIEALLLEMNDLSQTAATEMREACEAIEQDAPETEIFAEMVRYGVDFEVRLQALQALWQIVLKETPQPCAAQLDSPAVITHYRCALGLTDADNITARSMAQAQI